MFAHGCVYNGILCSDCATGSAHFQLFSSPALDDVKLGRNVQQRCARNFCSALAERIRGWWLGNVRPLYICRHAAVLIMQCVLLSSLRPGVLHGPPPQQPGPLP
jgi:hypothetical protein